MQFLIEDTLSGLVQDFKAGDFFLDVKPQRTHANKDEIRRVLISCLLSSGWKYEKSLEASLRFSECFPIGDDVPRLQEIEDFLRAPYVRHRFPISKAKQLFLSLKELSNFPSDTLFKSTELNGERIIRGIIQKKLPGFGYKQTSMFMRDIGASKHLAIIDSHILWYLEKSLQIKIKHLTPKKYLEVENIIHRVTERYEIDINSLDVLLWVLVREFKRNERSKSCGMQYVLPLAA